MKKLSLKLGREKKKKQHTEQSGWNSQKKMGKDELQRKSWRAAHKTPKGWNSSCGDFTQYSLTLDSLRDRGGCFGYNT